MTMNSSLFAEPWGTLPCSQELGTITCVQQHKYSLHLHTLFLYNVVACRDPLLSNECETNNEKSPLLGSRFSISNNWTAYDWTTTEEWCFLRCPYRDVTRRTIEAVSQLWAATASGQRLEHRSWRAVTKQRLGKTIEDGDLACAVMICKVCRSAIALYLLVVTSCVYTLKSWTNQVTNRNPV
jgi:hypothetical protein